MKDKPAHAKQHKNKSGKDLLGDKIKQNGKHKIDAQGKFEPSVDVSERQDGRRERRSTLDRGDVPVTKYKTHEADGRRPRRAESIFALARASRRTPICGTMWIGYAFIDDYDDRGHLTGSRTT